LANIGLCEAQQLVTAWSPITEGAGLHVGRLPIGPVHTHR